MTAPRHIAVLDIGKTNAKLALVDALELSEIAVVTRPNTVQCGPPYAHFDLEGHWQFFLQHLSSFNADYGIDAISVTTHGASCVLLDRNGELAAPMLDYEDAGPDALAPAYDTIRPDFSETGSPRLPAGLNLGAQLYWLFQTRPELRDRVAHILTYPQYWGYLLTGNYACDVSSLGCHTDLWNPFAGRFSSLVDRLGIAGMMAPARRSTEVLGTVRKVIAAQTRLSAQTPVSCGIHDSNASLYPYIGSRTGPFSVVSTGTWVVAMAVGGAGMQLDPNRDALINVNALGQPVPSSRFMGGREYELIRAGSDVEPSEADFDRVLKDQVMLLPAQRNGGQANADTGPRWSAEPSTEGERMVALSLYLALMTDNCLSLVGATGPVVVEGPFARNAHYVAMLSSLRADGVEVASSTTGTSIGAALLCVERPAAPKTSLVMVGAKTDGLMNYAKRWGSYV